MPSLSQSVQSRVSFFFVGQQSCPPAGDDDDAFFMRPTCLDEKLVHQCRCDQLEIIIGVSFIAPEQGLIVNLMHGIAQPHPYISEQGAHFVEVRLLGQWLVAFVPGAKSTLRTEPTPDAHPTPCSSVAERRPAPSQPQ